MQTKLSSEISHEKFMSTSPFNMDGGKITPNPLILSIPTFKTIWESDKSKEKELAFNQLAFIAHMVDIRSPYREYDEPARKEILMKEFSISSNQLKKLGPALKLYEELATTRAIRLLVAAFSGVDKITEYFHTADLNEVDEKGALVHKPTDMARNLKEVGGIVKSLRELRKTVEEEQAVSGNIRGGGEVSEWEKT